MVNIEIKPLWHKGKNQIALYFKYNEELASKLRSVDCEFSYTHRCWYIENTELNKRKLLFVLNNHAYQITEQDKKELKLATNLRADLTIEVMNDLSEFKKHLQVTRYGERTIEVYMSMLELFVGYFRDKDLKSITCYDVEKFNYEVIIRRKYSSSYQRQMMGVLRLFFRNYPGVIIDWEKVTRARRDSRLPVVLSAEEIYMIISGITNVKHRAIISLLYAAGLRVSELIGLKIADIDSMRMQIRVRQSKGKKDRYVGLSENILVLLRNYFDEYKPTDYLFNGPEGGKYSVESIRKILRDGCKRVGVIKEVTPHTLRHSYATHLLENGVDLRYVQELLGHSRPETTMIYTHVTRKKLVSIRSPFDMFFTPEFGKTTEANNPHYSTSKLLKGTDNQAKEPELTYG